MTTINLYREGQPRRPVQNGRVSSGGPRPPGPRPPSGGPRPVKRPPPPHLSGEFSRPVKKVVKKVAYSRTHDIGEVDSAPMPRQQHPVKKAVKKSASTALTNPRAVKKAIKKVAKVARNLDRIRNRQGISLTDDETLSNSIVGKNVETIQKLLEDGNFESATNTVHKAILQTLTDLIPFAEQAVRDSGGRHGVYQINSMMSMILETLNSARAQSDRGQLAQHLVERVIQPAFKTLAEALVREFMTLDVDLSTAPQDKVSDLTRETRNRLASSVQSVYTTISTDLVKFMSG